MATPTTAGLAAVDRWSDVRLAAHVRRTLHDDAAWAWDGYTNPAQVRRLRAALCAINGKLLGEALEARHRMAPSEYERWVRGNRAERDAVDRRLGQVKALKRVAPAALLPKVGEPFNFAAAVAKMARTGMADAQIGAVFKASASHIRNIRGETKTRPGSYYRKSARERAAKAWSREVTEARAISVD